MVILILLKKIVPFTIGNVKIGLSDRDLGQSWYVEFRLARSQRMCYHKSNKKFKICIVNDLNSEVSFVIIITDEGLFN
jgi:hypothetical protein